MDRKSPPERLSGHIVICNANSKVRRIVEDIFVGEPDPCPDVLLIIQDEELWDHHPAWHPQPPWRTNFYELVGLPSQHAVLERANVKEATAAIILADPRQGALADARTTMVALAIEAENRDVQTVVELIRSENRAHLANTAVDDVISVGAATERLLAQSCVTPWIKDVFKHLLSSARHTGQIYVPRLSASLAGRSFRELATAAVENGAPYVICGFVRTIDGEPHLFISPRAHTEPGKDSPLDTNDMLIIIGNKRPDLEILTRVD